MKKQNNKKFCSICICLVLVGVMFVSAVSFDGVAQTGKDDVAKQDTDGTDVTTDMENPNGSLSAEGTATMQAKEQIFDFSLENIELTVQEVYVESGSTVQEGDPLLKLDSDGVAAAVAYYEKAVDKAEKELASAQLACEKGVLEAEAALLETQTQANHAAEKYEASLGGIEAEAEEKKAEYEETVEEIQTLQADLDQGTYYTQAQINEKQDAVNRTETEYMSSEQALVSAQGTYEQVKAELNAAITTLQQQISVDTEKEILLQTVQQVAVLSERMEQETVNVANAVSAKEQKASERDQAKQNFESAVKEYDAKVEQANTKIAELTESLEGLQEQYEQAERDVVTKKAELENEYKQAVLAGDYADTQYQASLLELVSALEKAEQQLQELQEEQALFLAFAEGKVLAEYAGTIASVTYEEGDIIRQGMAVASYYEAETIWISVEIAQEHIAEIAVGDTVTVQTGQMRGSMSGTVASVASSKTSGGSMSDVTYAVEITVDNSEKRLQTGTSVTVLFEDRDESGGEKKGEREE